jgi:hypothetical protein
MADTPDMLSTPISKLSLNNTPPIQPELNKNKKDLSHPSYDDLLKDATALQETPPQPSNGGSYNEQLVDLEKTKQFYGQAPILQEQPQQDVYASYPSSMPMSYPPLPTPPSKPVSQNIRDSLWQYRHNIAISFLFMVGLMYGVPKMIQYMPVFASTGTMQPKMTGKAIFVLAALLGVLYMVIEKFVLN